MILGSLETIWLDAEDDATISLVLDRELLIIVLDETELSIIEDEVMGVLDWIWLLEGGKELLVMELSWVLLMVSDEVTKEEEETILEGCEGE